VNPNADIVAKAREFLGCRWRHQGRSRHGVDCAGLVIEVAKAVRGSHFDKRDYERHASDETMLNLCAEHLTRIKVSEAQPGDVMVFAFEHQRHIAIVGDYVHGGLSLIHAYLPARKVVETRLDDKWLARARGCFRFPERM
jgi:cell wall-associated NlpC family hydrolase